MSSHTDCVQITIQRVAADRTPLHLGPWAYNFEDCHLKGQSIISPSHPERRTLLPI